MTIMTEPAQLSQAAVEEMSQRFNEPAWMRDRRVQAWKMYTQLQWPPAHDPTWKYVKPDAFQMDAMRLASDVTPALVVPRVPGATVQTFANAIREQPALMERWLATQAVTASDGKFEAWHTALMNGGVVIHVSRDVVVDVPVQVSWQYPEAGCVYAPHVLIVADENSRVAVLDTYTSQTDGRAVHCGAVEVIAGRGAHVTYAVEQSLEPTVNHLSFQRVLADRDAQVQSVLLATGGHIARYQVVTTAQGPGANTQWLGVRVSQGEQQSHVVSLQDHPASQTVSDLLLKSALYDGALGSYYGTIRIRPHAQQCEAYQADRNLLLGDHAKAESTPVLEIEADEVRCTHGASVGPVDQQQLFYMGARGIPTDVAQTMLVYGFLEGVWARIRDRAVRDHVTNRLINAVGALDLITQDSAQ